MVRMGNACTCCHSLYRTSPNMKSAVSSSSSGSERVSVGGVASGSGYDLEETKAKTNSRMSCASDDSCAINELLEGRMDLSVTLPNSANPVVINVERRTPMLDLLVNISTQYRFNAANYTINAADHEFKASTPIGSLDVNQISIIAKNAKSSSLKGNAPSAVPFQTTFRLQVNLPRNQLMVMRVTPNATIAAIKQIICSEKALDANKYQLVRFTGKNEGPHILDSSKTLAFYTLNEVTLVSNKNLAQIELQYVTSSASQVDMPTTRANSIDDSVMKKSINSLIVSQSNPDFSTIDEKTALNHMSVKHQKKRPAPPPPMSSAATLPNKSFSLQMSPNNKENESIESLKNDSNLRFVEKVSQTPQTTDENKPILKVPKSVTHVRQNSGSDSSGYHESVLSSDSPESSSATTLHKSSSMADNNSKQTDNNIVLNQKSVTKKRRAPPPPTNYSTQDSGPQQVKPINGHNHNDITDESKVVLECMSDVSLPLSSSSSSSGTASDINRSLSPIVITETNGSSTPLQTSLNLRHNSLDSESTQCSSPSDTTKDSQTQESSEKTVISENHIKQLDTNSQQLDERDLSINRSNSPDVDIEKEETFIKNEALIALNESNPSDNENTSKSRESLPKAEVSCTAPALTASHDTELSGHDCSEQVAESNTDSLVDIEKQDMNSDVNHNGDTQTNELSTHSSLNNSELDLEEISIRLPPPSPFQNRNDPQYDTPSTENPNEGQLIIEALSDISNEQMITNSDNLMTKEESIDNRMEIKQTKDCNQRENESQMTITSPIVSDEESFNKEIEVTLQSLNDELDRLEYSDRLESSDSMEDSEILHTNNQINSELNNENNCERDPNSDSNVNFSPEVKPTKNESFPQIESKFGRKESPTPSLTPRVLTPLIESVQESHIDSKDQLPITTNGKTTLFINNNQSVTARPFSPPTTSASPSPTNEDKLSITEEVRHLCRPRVRLTNFSIGSYKKEVDIFESTPVTAPVKSSTKSFVTFPSVKKEEKSRLPLNSSKSKVEITSNSMTAMTTVSKSTTPVIQTLITSAPKISRIQSWSGQKSVCLQEKNIKLPVKTSERYVSQISITKDLKNVNKNSDKESNEDLRSPHLVVQSLTAKIEDQMKSRSPSPKQVIQKLESNKEKITISIKPGLESIISSNSKQNDTQNNAINEKKAQNKNNHQSIEKTNKNKQSARVGTPSPVPPPVPPPIPPPEPQIIASHPTNYSSKNQINTKIFHTKGWKSERVSRSGQVPKVKHVDPPSTVNVRDQLLNEIKSFGGKNSLKRVSNNSSWKLEVNPINT